MSHSSASSGTGFSHARRWFDAVLMAIAGIFGLVNAGMSEYPFLVVLISLGAFGYAAWIALSGNAYSMPIVLYLLPVGGVLWLLWG